MAIDLSKVRGDYEVVCAIENLVTLRIEACLRITVTNSDALLYDRYCIIEVPE